MPSENTLSDLRSLSQRALRQRLTILQNLSEHHERAANWQEALRQRSSMLKLCHEQLPQSTDQDLNSWLRNYLREQHGHLQNIYMLLAQQANQASEPAQAIEHYQACLEFGPPPPLFYRKLANCFEALGEYASAVQYYQLATEQDPQDHEAYRQLGDCYSFRLQDGLRALKAYEHCARLGPPNAYLYNAMGHFYFTFGKIPQAVEFFERSAALLPADLGVLSNLLFAARMQENLSPQEFARITQHKVQKLREELGLKQVVPYGHPKPEPAKTKLRIGYLSSNFYNHVVSYYLYPILVHHDPEAVEVICYHSGRKQDWLTEKFKATGLFKEVAELSDRQLADEIYKDKIDILVELTGYQNDNSKVLSLLHKPAPIQASYMAYLQTYGFSEIDYFLSQAELSPPEEKEAFIEGLYYLPEYCCFERLNFSAEEAPVVETPILQKGYLTLGVFNQPSKYSEGTLKLWSRVLQAIPEARILFCRTPIDRESVLERCQQAGISPQRVDFEEYRIENYGLVDFCLDALPFNAVTTAFDAMIMGVPTLTLSGPGLPGRFGAYFNQRLNLSEWNASSPEDYVAKAVGFARQPQQLQHYRETGRQRLLESVFYDHAGFTRQLEAAYRDMWQTYCSDYAAKMEPALEA